MDDTNNSGEPPEDVDLGALVSLYMESLNARMDPQDYATLTRALYEFGRAMEAGGEGAFDIEGDTLNDAVRTELMMVMAILGTGRTDHQVVELTGPHGHEGWAVVSEAVANDSERLAALSGRLAELGQEWDETDAALEGIEQATRDQP
jgi:hypothetical protein